MNCDKIIVKELDENVEYEERESEFDVEDEDRDKVKLEICLMITNVKLYIM